VSQVTVTIDGKAYRMACDDGQEDHLVGLAKSLDSRIQEMRNAFGEIGDMRLSIMAGITAEDEVSELKRKLAVAEAAAAKSDSVQDKRDRQTADAVTALAERVERIAKNLAAG
jgi:cell division protein ZapA